MTVEPVEVVGIEGGGAAGQVHPYHATEIADSLYKHLTDAARPGRQARLQAIDALLGCCRERVVGVWPRRWPPLLPVPECPPEGAP